MVEFTVKCPVIVCTQTRMGICHVIKNVLRKPVLIGPLEYDIVKVWYNIPNFNDVIFNLCRKKPPRIRSIAVKEINKMS